MRVIAKKVLRDFWDKHPQAEQPLKAWFYEAEKSEWATPSDIKKLYKTASFLGKSRVVFNISGNKYRLIVHIRYDLKIVFIKFIGTHADYDKINAETI